MMISPDSYRLMISSYSYEALINERNELFNQIIEYEKKQQLKKDIDEIEVMITYPREETIYQMKLEYLKVVTDLILERINEDEEDDQW